jgi:hypothetical protein
MKVSRVSTAIVGAVQGAIGAVVMVLALMLYLNILEVQTIFNLPSELLPFYLMVLGLFSLFSIINGVYLIRRTEIK